MSKKHKKRNKPYTGIDAAPTQPSVHRYVAVERSALSEWWQSRKQLVKVVSIVAAVVLGVGYLLYELVNLIF